jgi:hypothetical protein
MGWRYLFEIPNNVVIEWMIKHQCNLLKAKWDSHGKALNDHAVKASKLLNDPDYAYLRTSNLKNPLVGR